MQLDTIKYRVIAAWGERASGPGLSNPVIWVLVMDLDGKYDVKCIQPKNQTSDLRQLQKVSAVMNETMVRAVEHFLKTTVDKQ